MIAHRLATVKACNIIYLLDNGKVADENSYQQLVERNAQFQQLAEHA